MAYLPSRICPLQFQLQVVVGPRHDFSPTLVVLFLGQEPWLSVFDGHSFPRVRAARRVCSLTLAMLGDCDTGV